MSDLLRYTVGGEFAAYSSEDDGAVGMETAGAAAGDVGGDLLVAEVRGLRLLRERPVNCILHYGVMRWVRELLAGC